MVHLEACLDQRQSQQWLTDVASSVRRGLEGVFSTRPDEVDCLDAMVTAVNAAPVLDVSVPHTSRRLQIELGARLLHGGRSMVTFEIAGASTNRELADLLLLAVYLPQGGPPRYRVSLNQSKRAYLAPRGLRFEIDSGQQTLLTAFPRFKGVSGPLKGQTIELRSASGMLGTYGFFVPPGDFSILGARVLGTALGGRQQAYLSDLGYLLGQGNGERGGPWLDSPHWSSCGCPYCEVLRDHHCYHRRHRQAPGVEFVLDRGVQACGSVEDFVRAWAGLRFGEPWQPDSGTAMDEAVTAVLRPMATQAGSPADDDGRNTVLRRFSRFWTDTSLSTGEPVGFDHSDDREGPKPLAVLVAQVTEEEGEQ